MKLLDLSPISIRSSDGPSIPGISSWTSKGWVHGREAIRNCRLDPQSTVFDVWENLSVEGVSPAEGMRHRADLAVAQLRSLALDTAADWCVAAPADWSRQTLQLFLGVAKECGLQVHGLFPRALAVAAVGLPGVEEGQVLEWGWKGLNLVQVSSREGEWHLSGLRPDRELGLLSVFRRESRLAAEWMLDRHRVDPLDSGETEQILFDGWWDWHSGEAVDWVAPAGKREMVLSEETDPLRELHSPFIQGSGSSEELRRITQPMLAHVLGCSGLISETHHLLPAVDGLQLSGAKGPQWRDHLRCTLSPEVKTVHATHVVINGTALPLPEGISARPSETVHLSDGRSGQAVLVQEG